MDGVVRQMGGRAEYRYDTAKCRNRSVEVNFGDAMTCVKMAFLGVADIKIDSDDDLIPDIVELRGILLTDLSFVYTNPHDEDTAWLEW